MLQLPPRRPNPLPIPGKNDFPATARMFLDDLFSHPDRWRLAYHRSQYHWWTGTHWTAVANDVLEHFVSRWFENTTHTVVRQGQQIQSPFPVNSDTLSNLLRAIRNQVIVNDKVNTNTWLSPQPGDPLPTDIVPMQNGLFNTATRELMPSTPRYFAMHAVSFAYDPDARMSMLPTFLRSVFGLDVERFNLAQEMIGYVCTPMMQYQKMFNLIGPPRSGKGTIARLIEQLVGEQNYGSTSLSALANDFGLDGIVDKPVVVLGDAAFAGGNKSRQALENLLGIIGEDAMTINPKQKRMYTAKLPCRFVLLANDLPVLPDAAGALRSRWLVLRFTETFMGREDRELGDKLAAELPGIFNWAMDGLDRLRLRGDFVQPQLGIEDLDIVTRMASPETVFVQECCVVSRDPDVRESTDDLYQAACNWCLEAGVRPWTKLEFGKALRRTPNAQHIARGRLPRDAEGRQPSATVGIQLTQEARDKYLKGRLEFEMSRFTG